jgi:hypothetical protein
MILDTIFVANTTSPSRVIVAETWRPMSSDQGERFPPPEFTSLNAGDNVTMPSWREALTDDR